MSRITTVLLLCLVAAFPLLAQTAATGDQLVQAQIALKNAEQVGAPAYAKSLYDEAAYNVQFAQQNWNSSNRSKRDEAQVRAVEGFWAARAALAKANWLGTNAAVRSLQGDITRLGGKSDVRLTEEASDMPINRGTDSRARIAYAQGIIDAAKTAGGDRIAAEDLKTAQAYLDSARKVTSRTANSETADQLAYQAEMMARQAYYMARSADAARNLAPLQLQRTQLAQSESDRAAAAERAQRQAAEKQQQELQAQLAAEQANRQAQADELARLRAQLDENRRAMQQRVEADRAARTQAEQQLDQAYARYEAAVANGSASDIEAARRQVEDQQIALRALQQREQLDEQSMAADIDRLRSQLDAARTQGTMTAEVLSQRQAELIARQQELDAFRRERADALARRAQLDQQRQASLSAAQKRRDEAEAQAQAMQRQVAAAQAAAQQAQEAAASAKQQVQQTAAELEKSRLEAQQTAAALEKSKAESQQALTAAQQQTQQTQAELEKTRAELAARDAEARQLRMQQELARIAATRTDPRGLVVTLSSALFDTGKSTLKSGAKSTLSRIAEQLKSDANIRVSVEGHTDSVGSAETNMTLSEKRANAVRDFLVGAGVQPSAITAAGKGEAEPVATNKTVAGRQQNRRVELIVTRQ